MFDFLRKRAKSEHQRAKELLSAYIDGALSSEEQALVEAHLDSCEECARNLRTLRRTVEFLGELPVVRAPRSFAIPAAQPVKRLGWAYAYLRMATALVAVLLVVVLVGDIFLIGRAPAVVPAPAAVREYEAETGEDMPEVAKEKPPSPPAEQKRLLAIEATPQPTPRSEVTETRLEFGALRWAEIALFLSTVILAFATVAIKHRRG